MKQYTITIFSENTIGTLARITNQFTRRKINIESLDVNETDIAGISLFTICVFSEQKWVDIIVKQVEKQVDVFRAFACEGHKSVDKSVQEYHNVLKARFA